MKIEIVTKSFEIVGIKRKCLYKEYRTVMPEARAVLNQRMDEIRNRTDTQLVIYEMSQEPASPERQEIFYMGMATNRADEIPSAMEHVVVPAQSFARVTVQGPLSGISKAYEALHRFIEHNGWRENKESYLVELYDESFDPTRAANEMEIYYPVKR